MDIYEVLGKDHERIRSMVQKIANIDDPPSQIRTHYLDEMIDRLKHELIPHTRAAEAVFYNPLRTIEFSRVYAIRAFEEHMEMEGLLTVLQLKDKNEPEWREIARELARLFDHHVKGEEAKLFAVAKEMFSAEDAQSMARAYENLKPQVSDGSFLRTKITKIAEKLPPTLAAAVRTFGYQ